MAPETPTSEVDNQQAPVASQDTGQAKIDPPTQSIPAENARAKRLYDLLVNGDQPKQDTLNTNSSANNSDGTQSQAKTDARPLQTPTAETSAGKTLLNILLGAHPPGGLSLRQAGRFGAAALGLIKGEQAKLTSEIEAKIEAASRDPQSVTAYLLSKAQTPKVGVNLNQEFAAKTYRVFQRLQAQGYQFQLSSGVRDKHEQAYLKSKVGQKGGPPMAAAAGKSMHEYGCAADISYLGGGKGETQFRRDLATAARAEGLEYNHSDKFHICVPHDEFHAGLKEGRYHHIEKVSAKEEIAQMSPNDGSQKIVPKNPKPAPFGTHT